VELLQQLLFHNSHLTMTTIHAIDHHHDVHNEIAVEPPPPPPPPHNAEVTMSILILAAIRQRR